MKVQTHLFAPPKSVRGACDNHLINYSRRRKLVNGSLRPVMWDIQRLNRILISPYRSPRALTQAHDEFWGSHAVFWEPQDSSNTGSRGPHAGSREPVRAQHRLHGIQCSGFWGPWFLGGSRRVMGAQTGSWESERPHGDLWCKSVGYFAKIKLNTGGGALRLRGIDGKFAPSSENSFRRHSVFILFHTKERWYNCVKTYHVMPKIHRHIILICKLVFFELNQSIS